MLAGENMADFPVTDKSDLTLNTVFKMVVKEHDFSMNLTHVT